MELEARSVVWQVGKRAVAIRTATRCLAALSLALGIAARLRVHSAALDPSLFAYAAKMLGGACAPWLGVAGAAAAASGLAAGDAVAATLGAAGALLAADCTRRIAAPHDGFEQAFGPDWASQMAPGPAARMQRRRWSWFLAMPAPPQVRRDLAFWSLPTCAGAGSQSGNRELLCDLWEPPRGTARSGLAIVYLHAGAWQSYDKGVGTGPFFSHLAGQGHTVMDVAYRLCGESNMAGMLDDVRRAVAWLKDNARQFSVDPGRIVLMGASAGGHLALLAAFTHGEPSMQPADVRRADTSVRGVVAYYAPTDMLTFGDGPVHPDWPAFVRIARRLGIAPRGEYLAWPDVERRLFGAPAREAPQIARRYSPITWVGPTCPPVLLIHGTHDRVVPAARSSELCEALRRHGVPAVLCSLAMVDHAFDLPMLQISLPAQAALYDVERFLALMAGRGDLSGRAAVGT